MQPRISNRTDADEFLTRLGLQHGRTVREGGAGGEERPFWLYDASGRYVGESDLTAEDMRRVSSALNEGELLIVLDPREATLLHNRLRRASRAERGDAVPAGFCVHCHRAQDDEGRHMDDRDPTIADLAAIALYIFGRGELSICGHPFGVARMNEQFLANVDLRATLITREQAYDVLGVPLPVSA